MINFFRKIRRKYADDNKPLKYARYAIGEILLVVIGILIALQVNNWNEEKKTRAVELNYLENIKSDLELNLVELKEFIVERQKSIKASDSILVMFEGGAELDMNAFNRYSINVMVWFPLEYHDNTYQELVNSGKLSIISNKVIKNHLQNMQTSFKKVVFIENEMQQDFESYMYDPFFNIADLKTSFDNYNAQLLKLSPDKLLDSSQVKTLLKHQAYKNGFVLSAYNSELLISEYSKVTQTTNQLIDLIDEELN